jgi:CheY-specific phosphatase CheX
MPLANAEIVNALLEPVMRALRSWAGVGGSLAKLDVATSLPPPPGIAVSIEIRGRLVGSISWNFELPVAHQIAETMLASAGGGPPRSIDAGMCADAVTELANIIAGNASGVLSAAGYPVEIMPPETVVRDAESPLADKALSFTFETPSGKMTMFICVQIDQAALAQGKARAPLRLV